MQDKFNTVAVMHALGTAPSTSALIAGVLNGRVDPHDFRNVQCWPPLGYWGVPSRPVDILTAVNELMNGPKEVKIGAVDGEGDEVLFLYLDTGIDSQPTVIWDTGADTYLLESIEEMCNTTHKGK